MSDIAADAHPIPPITDPIGRYWNQPPREEVLVDDSHAVMTAETLAKLLNYDITDPSGAYEGKMWRRGDLEFGSVGWLCWYGHSEKPGMVSVNVRPILLA